MGDHGAGQLSVQGGRVPFWRSGPGCYGVDLEPEERQLLRELPMQLRAAITINRADPAFRRLFPPAYAEDAAFEEEYRLLVGDELDESRSEALATLARTADATELSEADLDAWSRALNGMRLWLGTVLDVSEDTVPDDPDDPPHMLYHALSLLQELVIEVLTEEE